MNLEAKEPFTGICIPLAEHDAGSGEAVELSDHDMTALEGVSLLYRHLRVTFKHTLGRPTLIDAVIQMALLADEGEITQPASQIFADLCLTATELKANAKLERPLPHSKTLSYPSLGKLLDALCKANRKSGARLIVCSQEGGFEVPILTPGDFIEPVRTDLHRQTGTFDITGLHRDEKRGRHGFFLDTSLVLLQLPTDDPTWSWNAIKDVLMQPTCLVGTIARADKSSDWMPEKCAHLECQEHFAEMRKIEVEVE